MLWSSRPAEATRCRRCDGPARAPYGVYDVGIKITDDELAAITIKRDNFHGEWNYCISLQLL